MADKRSASIFGIPVGPRRSSTSQRRSGRGPKEIRGAGRFFHLLGVIAMLAGMFLPLTDVGQAMASPETWRETMRAREMAQDVTTTSFTQAAVTGDFQPQLGCDANDVYCPATQLTNHEGIWTGSFPIPPGQWQWQISALTQDGQQITLSAESQPDQPSAISVDEADAGAFFLFNAAKQTAEGMPVAQIATLSTDFGNFALQTDGADFTTIVQAPQAGPISVEMQIDGVPTGNLQTIAVEQGPNRVTVDGVGTVLGSESLGYGSLTITRVDGATGEPIGGGCYEVLSGGTVITRGCYTDDGAADGSVRLTFPDGLDAGTYTVQEVVAPKGAEQAPEQSIDLQNGDNSIEISTGEPAGDNADEGDDDGGLIEIGQSNEDESDLAAEIPEEDAAPGDLFVSLQDQAGQPIGGACFQLLRDDEVVQESCDIEDSFPLNGNTGFFDVPAGTYTLHQSGTPDGTQPVPDEDVDVPANDENNVTLQAPASDQPTPEETGDIVVLRQDADDRSVGGACFELVGQDGNVVGEAVCDEDGDVADDGRTGFSDVPTGTYTLRESRTPEGYEPAADVSVEVMSAQVTEVPVQSTLIPIDEPTETPTEEPTEAPTEEATAEPTEEASPTEAPTEAAAPGSLIVTLQDQDNQPLGDACFELRQGDDVTASVCDSDDPFPGNGNTGFFGVPSGTYTLHQSTIPEGTQPIADQEVEVVAGGDDTIIVTAPALDAPTAEPTAEVTPTEEPTEPIDGSVVVDVTGVDTSQGEICIEINTSGGIGMLRAPVACDNGEDDADSTPGIIRVEGVPAGDYVLYVAHGPDDLVIGEAQPISVIDGDVANVTLTPPAPEPTATLEPTPEPTATLEPTAEPTPEPGTIDVAFQTDAGEPVTAEGGCVAVAGVVDSVCDNSDADANPEPGIVGVANVDAGSYDGSIIEAPDGFTPVDEIFSAQVAPAETAMVAMEVAQETGIQPVVAVDANGTALPGACWTVSGNDVELGPLCDDGANGGTAADGRIQFEQLAPGPYVLTQISPPDGYSPVDPIEVTVTTGENVPVQVEHVAVTVSVNVTTTNSDEIALPGACYALDGGTPVCDDDEDGTVTFEGVAPGDHVVSQTTSPAGYKPAADQTQTVSADGTAAFSFVNLAHTGSVSVQVLDEENAPLAGACVVIDGGAAICDDDGSDVNTTDAGTIQIDGIGLGEHQVALQDAPDDFELPVDPMTVTVEANTVAPVEFQLARVAPTTGGIDVTIEMESGELVPEACITLSNSIDASVAGPYCDGSAEDTNDDAGVIGVDDIEAGTYVVGLAEGTEIPGGDVSGANSPSIDVIGGDRSAARITVPAAPETGTVRIGTTNGDVNLPGACYTLDGGTPMCDGDGQDANGTDGVIDIIDLAPGPYALTMTTAPGGYEAAAVTDVTVTVGETTTVEVTVTAIPEPGSLTVTKLNGAGEPLGGACFAVQQDGVTIASVCDADDATPNDGTMEFEGLVAGDYRLVETRAPSNQYEAAAPQIVTITAGENATVEVTNVQKAGRLVVTTVPDEDRSQRLNNACYRIEGEPVYGPFCDADDGAVDGRVTFVNVTAGDYTLVQNVAPTGYEPVENRAVTITAGSSLQITVANVQTAPPAETGQLVVIPLDENGAEVSGGCYQVFDGDQVITDRVCDSDDEVDKRIIFNALPVGTYTVREMLAPSPSFQTAADQDVTITLNERTDVQFAHELKTGRLLVQAVNDTNQPLAGACFDLTDDGQDPLCSESAGDVLFADVPAGTDTLTQTEAPYGYELDETARDVTVQPGQTTVVRIVFTSAPPPDTGSVQVQKFVCPAGEDGDRTEFLGGAQGNAQLAQTADCIPAVAGFTLEAEDGSGNGPGAFSTSNEGRYRVTVKEGIYVLTETNPDLPGSSSARLRVGTGQMTTVIVINYVAPPAPEAATIDVVSYTCPPSFNGTSYSDFAASCASEEDLTNNLTVRAEGENNYKQVTGDTGQLGTTRFAELPAGEYNVYGEKPFNMPIMYMFCGADPDAPAEVKAINGAFPVTLGNGEAMTCHFFQVPEQLTQTTGGILVQKFSCAIDNPVKGYDWANECERSAEQVPFELNKFNLEMQRFEPFTETTANPDGLVRFTELAPGTYELKEIGSKWCFAQSNSVDADGNVVVQANKLSEVWIYNCIGASEPPNTGSGDAAALLNPTDGTNAGAMMLLNLAWPAVAAAAWMVWRSRHQSGGPVVVRREDNPAA